MGRMGRRRRMGVGGMGLRVRFTVWSRVVAGTRGMDVTVAVTAPSPCHPVTLSPRHLVTPSPCHPVTLSLCHPVTLSPCHLGLTPTSPKYREQKTVENLSYGHERRPPAFLHDSCRMSGVTREALARRRLFCTLLGSRRLLHDGPFSEYQWFFCQTDRVLLLKDWMFRSRVVATESSDVAAISPRVV